MFVKRSRYDALMKENQGLLDEMLGLRGELRKSLTKNEKQTESIDILYKEAKISAATIAKKSAELKEVNKDSQRLEQLKQDMKAVKFDLTEYVEPGPSDPEQRALYVSRIAGYFNGGLKDYINYILSGFKAEISRFPLSEAETNFYRSGVNLCYLLVEWGDKMVSENNANAVGSRETEPENAFTASSEDEEAVENIKKSVNN